MVSWWVITFLVFILEAISRTELSLTIDRCLVHDFLACVSLWSEYTAFFDVSFFLFLTSKNHFIFFFNILILVLLSNLLWVSCVEADLVSLIRLFAHLSLAVLFIRMFVLLHSMKVWIKLLIRGPFHYLAVLLRRNNFRSLTV